MELNDFKKADCRLFRVPPIDFSGVEETIETAIFEAWKNQGRASNAVDSITGNRTILGNLTNQISESLGFQRRVGLEKVEKQEAEKVAWYQQIQREKINSVEQTVGYQAKLKQEELARKADELFGKRKTYDASQASLEQTRYRIQQRMSSLGEQKAVDAFILMNEAILEDPVPKTKTHPEQTKTELPTYNPQNPSQSSANPAQTYTAPAKPISRGKRIIKKIWGVLNYKIW